MRDERAAGADPGPPSTKARAGAGRQTLGRIRFLLRSRWAVVTLAIFCIVLLLVTELPSPAPWSGQPRGLQFDSSSLPGTSGTFYPYLVNASAYPGIGTLSASTVCSQIDYGASGGAPHNLSYPQVVTVVVVGANANLTAGGNITETGANQIWTGVSGPVMVMGIAIAVVLEVAVGTLALISAEVSDLVSIVVGLLIGVLLSILLPTVNAYVTARSALIAEGLANESVSKGDNQSYWDVAASSFGWFDAGFTSVVGAQELETALSTKTSTGELANTAVAFALSLVAAALAFVAVAIRSTILTVFGLAVATASVVTDALGIFGGSSLGWGWEVEDVDYVILGMDSFVAAYDIYDGLVHGI